MLDDDSFGIVQEFDCPNCQTLISDLPPHNTQAICAFCGVIIDLETGKYGKQ